MKSLFRTLPVLAAAALPLSASAGSLSLTGDTTGAPTFLRTTVTGALSAYTVPYQAYVFTVSQDGLYDFTLSATDPSVFDTFLHLYSGSFDPAAADLNFLRANDDRTFNSPELGSALTGVSLASASTYYLVADGFLPSDYGAYTASVSGPGNISASAVPEPSTLALGGVLGGAFMLLILRRRRQRGLLALA